MTDLAGSTMASPQLRTLVAWLSWMWQLLATVVLPNTIAISSSVRLRNLSDSPTTKTPTRQHLSKFLFPAIPYEVVGMACGEVLPPLTNALYHAMFVIPADP